MHRFLDAFRTWERLRNKGFTLLCAGSFRRLGRRTVLSLPIRLGGEARIALGHGVFIGPNSWLEALDTPDQPASETAISIGDGTSVAGFCTITAVREVVLEPEVLVGRYVHISDHSHRFSAREAAVKNQGITKVAPVRIGTGAWIGQGAVICPGVTIGRNAVIGANSVVRADVGDHCVAAGAPARIIRQHPPPLGEPGEPGESGARPSG